MYQPEYLVIALSTLGLLLRTRAAYFREAYEAASEKEQDLREAVAELRRLRASEARARREAEEAARIKSEFLAHVSHEVRTPLNAISGTAQMLKQTTLTTEQQEYVELLITGSETLEAILGNILDFARIEAGKVELEQRTVCVTEAVDEAIKLLQPLASANGLALSRHIGPGVPATITTDPTRLRQVLLNLLSNAVKFTESGSVTVTVTRTSGDKAGPLLRFAVRDTGCGIPMEQQENLFQPFTQGDRGTTRRHGGAGLGLAICRELVTLMGGEIYLRSQPGRGSTFTFTIYIASDPATTL